MKRIVFLCLLICMVGLPAICPAQTAQSLSLTQNDRLLLKPEWDGAVMQTPWLQGGVGYEDYDYSDVVNLGVTFISSLPSVRKLELGGRLYYLNVDGDSDLIAEDGDGLSDIDIWGKYQVISNSDFMLSVGLLLTLPTGSEDIPDIRSTGEVNAELFAGGRYQANKQMAVIGHLGFRQNSDMDVETRFGTTLELEGELQVELGGGVLYQATSNFQLQGELNFATEAYDDGDNFILLSGGADYAINSNLHFKGGLGLGLDDGAPDLALTFNLAYLF